MCGFYQEIFHFSGNFIEILMYQAKYSRYVVFVYPNIIIWSAEWTCCSGNEFQWCKCFTEIQQWLVDRTTG